jgi:hypothetical protein
VQGDFGGGASVARPHPGDALDPGQVRSGGRRLATLGNAGGSTQARPAWPRLNDPRYRPPAPGPYAHAFSLVCAAIFGRKGYKPSAAVQAEPTAPPRFLAELEATTGAVLAELTAAMAGASVGEWTGRLLS